MVTILQNPLIQRDITILRDKNTLSVDFRVALRRVALLLAAQTATALPVKTFAVETPLEKTGGYSLDCNIILLPILRAGLSLLDSFLELFPDASVGYIGLKRNEITLEPHEYYFKIPPINEKSIVIVLDPMIATGGSICVTLEKMQLEGAKHFIVAGVISSPEGIANIRTKFPQSAIFTATLDRCLNEKGYILPGLGDAGDRINGTTD